MNEHILNNNYVDATNSQINIIIIMYRSLSGMQKTSSIDHSLLATILYLYSCVYHCKNELVEIHIPLKDLQKISVHVTHWNSHPISHHQQASITAL